LEKNINHSEEMEDESSNNTVKDLEQNAGHSEGTKDTSLKRCRTP
jgi:hypothetical protein